MICFKALSSTVHADPTAAHYKFHDDPYLIPYSNLSKRSFALSQEAGRKAAQWIRQQNPELFQHRVAEPLVEVRYNVLGIRKISRETKQKLLELVCFYNCNDALSEEWIEERWYRQKQKSKEWRKNVWKDGGFAEQLYNELGGKDSESLCALISGMCSHGQIDQGWKLYEQARANGIKLNTLTYNNLLAKICFLMESHPMVMENIEKLLKEMDQEGIRPNLDTLNSVLETLSNMSSYKNAKTFATQLLAEFKMLGITPSLASFYHLINLFGSDRRQLRGALNSILSYLEQNSVEIADLNDTAFFTKAMEYVCHRLEDKDLAYRLSLLLHKDNNYNFIGDSYRESLYYRYYFLCLCKTESLNVVMDIYDSLVPHIYIPEPIVMKELLTTIEINAAWNELPRIWSDIVLFEQDDRTDICERILGLASMNTEKSLNEALAKMGWSIWEKIEASTRSSLEWTGPLLGDLMIVLLANDDLSRAHLVMDKMERLQNQVIGEPKVSALLRYLDLCITENSADAAIKCIRFCNDMGLIETEDMARNLYRSLQLKDQQIERLSAIVGKDALSLEGKKIVEN
uniref:Small ribosomal subunit protein mS39 n=1 Tax=Rhodnius prolixus TaxID=13249 RepID=T1HBK0_RHOPR